MTQTVSTETEKSREVRTITKAECDRIIDRIVAECERRNMHATIAIVNYSGVLTALARTDGAYATWAVDVSIAKAQSAINSGKSTRELWETMRKDELLLSQVPFIEGMCVLPGGVLIKDGDAVIGALGVGGNTLYPDDEYLCAVGLG